MNNYIKGKDGVLFPFRCGQVPTATEIFDSLRLGGKVKTLKEVFFYGFQCEEGEGKDKYIGNQGGITIQPIGMIVLEKHPEGGDGLYLLGKCISTRPGTGPQEAQIQEELSGYVCGKINLSHGDGVLHFANEITDLWNVLDSLMKENLKE